MVAGLFSSDRRKSVYAWSRWGVSTCLSIVSLLIVSYRYFTESTKDSPQLYMLLWAVLFDRSAALIRILQLYFIFLLPTP